MADDPFLLHDLWTASWMSKGSAPTAGDETYWRDNSAGMLERGPQIGYRSKVFPEWDAGRAYRIDRMLGWQSGGADIPPFGSWANPPAAFHDVPPFPGEASPEQPPATTELPPPSVDPTLASILEQRHYAVMGEFLALRTQIADLQKTITAARGSMADQSTRFQAGLKAVKTIAAQLIADSLKAAPAKAATPKKTPATKKKP